MPLTIITDKAQARRLYVKGIHLPPAHLRDVNMGGYAVVDSPNEVVMVGTSGALTCMIIVVHKARGHGALGHYGGHQNADKVIQGLFDMVQRLGGGPIEAVVFAAGLVGSTAREQAKYEHDILSRARQVCPGAQVSWAKEAVYDAAYYSPHDEEVGLLKRPLGTFYGANVTPCIDPQRY
jgi:hypothetical protein